MSEAYKILKERLDRAALGVVCSPEGLIPFALNRAYRKVLDRAFQDGLIVAPFVISPAGEVGVTLRPDEVGKIDSMIEFI